MQSMLYAGHDGPRRAIDDYVPMTTMALSLGGMFSSRLMFRLREDKGYTYGYRSRHEVDTNLAWATLPLPAALWDELQAERLLPGHAPTRRNAVTA